MYSKNNSVFYLPAMLLCWCCAVQSHSVTAQEMTPRQLFNQHVQQEQWQQAYQLALELEAELAGEPGFDFAYGSVALKTGQFNQAVFALERAYSNDPTAEPVRMALAQAYYFTGNLPAAQQLLLADFRSPELTEAKQQLIGLITQTENKQKSYLKQRVRYAFGYDSNVNSGTAEDRIFVPSLGDIVVFPGSQQSEDEFHQLTYSLDARWQLDPQYALLTDVSIGGSKFLQLNQYDRENASFRLGMAADYQDFSHQLRAYARPLRLDGRMYRNDYGAELKSRYQMNTKNAFFTQLGYGRSDNRWDERLDLDVLNGALGWEYQGLRWIGQMELSYTDEQSQRATADYNSRDIYGAALTLLYPLSDRQLLLVRADLQDIEYAAPHPLFRQTREETLRSVSAAWYWQWTKDITTELRCGYSDKSSSLPLYQYDRTECLLGASYAF